MFNSFKISYKLKITYITNEIIYSLSALPIIGKLFIKKLEGNNIVKEIILILSFFYTIIKPFVLNFIYFGFLIFFPSFGDINKFLTLYFFLTLGGLVVNTSLFNPSKDKYYAIFNLKMDAKEYILSNYFCEMIKIYLSSIPPLVLFGLPLGMKPITILLLPLFVIGIKTLFNVLYLKSRRFKNLASLNSVEWLIVFSLVTILYAFVFIYPIINPLSFTIILFLMILSLPYTINILLKNNSYRKIYIEILSKNNFKFEEPNNKTKQIKTVTQNQMKYVNVKTNKKGMAYLNDIFVKRHKKILLNSSITYAVIIFITFLILLAMQAIKGDIGLAEITLNYIPYFTFFMYAINSGQHITNAYFINCDHSMLNYNFFKTPKNILLLFKERLISVIKINLIPAVVLSIGLLLILITNNITNYIYYLVLPLSIISMSVFFSVHYLVLYYLLQPFNMQSEMVNSTYRVIVLLTYLFIYKMTDYKIETLYIAPIIIIFTIIYIIVALLLVYKKAYKTFRIR